MRDDDFFEDLKKEYPDSAALIDRLVAIINVRPDPKGTVKKNFIRVIRFTRVAQGGIDWKLINRLVTAAESGDLKGGIMSPMTAYSVDRPLSPRVLALMVFIAALGAGAYILACPGGSGGHCSSFGDFITRFHSLIIQKAGL